MISVISSASFPTLLNLPTGRQVQKKPKKKEFVYTLTSGTYSRVKGIVEAPSTKSSHLFKRGFFCNF